MRILIATASMTESAWKKLKSHERKAYVLKHPTSKWAERHKADGPISRDHVGHYQALLERKIPGFKPAQEIGASAHAYPSIGKIKLIDGIDIIVDYPKLHDGSPVLSFGLDTRSSNDLIDSAKDAPAGHKTRMDEIAKAMKPKLDAMKEAGFKIVAVPSPAGGPDRYTATLPKTETPQEGAKPKLAKGQQQWGIRVTANYGRGNSQTFRSCQDSAGPWLNKEEAEHWIDSLKEQLAYDDEFKSPNFQAVPV